MNSRDAVELLRDAVPATPGTWADVGSGDGTFTRALAERLGATSRIYAVDRDRRALAALERWAKNSAAEIVTVQADFTKAFTLPGIDEGGLDGMLLANALHFVREPGDVLRRLVRWLRPGGRVVLVEYDHRRANPWVPHPIAST